MRVADTDASVKCFTSGIAVPRDLFEINVEFRTNRFVWLLIES